MRQVLSCAEMRAADRYTIEERGVPSQTLMERAGAAIAEEAEALLREDGGASVLAVCGGGNNGGDGWCAARLLAARGYRTAVLPVGETRSADCAVQRAKYAGEVLAAFPAEKPDLIIDALFGTGFRGTPEGEFAAAIGAVNQSGAKVVAADIPSGLNGDNGSFALCVRADVTVAVGELKTGLVTGRAADVCGRVVRRGIGIELPAPPRAALCEGSDFSPYFAKRACDSHKGSYGRAAILGGSLAYSGAPLLSAAAALRGGCGYTELCVPAELFPHCIGKLPETILTAAPTEGGPLACDEKFLAALCARSDAIAVGMGAGKSRPLHAVVRFLLENFAGTLILDADALNALAAYGVSVLKKPRACSLVLTPHPGEFARLCGENVARVRAEGAALAQAFAAAYGCCVLLKDNVTLLADGERVRYIASGTPALAKGGSGDVLAGLLVSLAARKVPAAEAACCASYLLGRAGALAAEALGNEYSVCARDVIAQIPRAIAGIAEK